MGRSNQHHGGSQEPSGGYPTEIMGALAMDPSALQGYNCAAMLSNEMLTKFRMISIKTSFIQPEGGSVVPCTSQRGNGDEILTLCSRKYLLQWRAEKQKSVSHHHPEDSHCEDQDHHQHQAGVKASRSRIILL